MDDCEVRQIQDWLNTRRETTFRWGTRMLRGGQRYYSPCVFDRTGWENFYLSLPYDYDVKNDKVFNASFSTYKRLGDLGFKWPEPTTKEALRTGYCGPDRDAFCRPAFLRTMQNDKRPEPAYRLHLNDRTNLHYLNADPLEGVLPYGRQGDMTRAKSITHRDYKWRLKCCPPPCVKPTYEREVHKFAKTDIQQRAAGLIDRVIKFDDDANYDDVFETDLIKLKKAYNWPINPITDEPLGGSLRYRNTPGVDCKRVKKAIWPAGNIPEDPRGDDIHIPRDRCDVLAVRPKEYKPDPCPLNPTKNMIAYLQTRFPQPNWECWEEVPDDCKQDCGCCSCPYHTIPKAAIKKEPDYDDELCPNLDK